MFSFRKRLLYPVMVERRDILFAQTLLEHYGGKDSEFSAVSQYLNHHSNLSNRYVKELMGMIAAEEMSHMEMIGLAISRLGGTLNYVNSAGAPWSPNYLDQSSDPVAMLKADEEAEHRSRQLYHEHLRLARDPGLKRMIAFLIKREGVHQDLFHKARLLTLEDAPDDQFATLIYEYKMSLQVLE